MNVGVMRVVGHYYQSTNESLRLVKLRESVMTFFRLSASKVTRNK